MMSTNGQWAVKRGFTVVELLVILVVIAILAGIIIVSYTRVQTDAKNAAIISTAEQVAKSIKSYIGLTGEYPLTIASGQIHSCTVVQTGCMDASASYPMDSTFKDAMTSVVGSLPLTVPKVGSVAYGVRYNYNTARTYNGVSQPVVIQYFLIGSNVDCKLPRSGTSNWTALMPSSTGYYNSGSYSDGKTYTQCIVSIDGPRL